MENIKQMVAEINKEVAKFDILDWSIFKMCLVIYGIIISTVFPNFSKKCRPLLIITWICLFAYIMLKLIPNLLSKPIDLDEN